MAESGNRKHHWRERGLYAGTDWLTLIEAAEGVLRNLRIKHVGSSS
jgi:hypothetical protein